MNSKTLQIATFGTEDISGVQAGLRNFPVHKLILLYFEEDKQKVTEYESQIRSTLGISVSKKILKTPDLIKSALETVNQILTDEKDNFDQFLINVSAGNKMMGCAAITSAFVNGVTAFDTMPDGNPVLLPVMKLSYNEMISDAKLDILKAIDEAGGSVNTLGEITKITDFGKPLLSYHIHGNDESKGLVQLGLVDSERLERGKTKITLNTLGKMLILNH